MIPAASLVQGLHRQAERLPLPRAIARERCAACDLEILNAPDIGAGRGRMPPQDVCSWRCALVLIERERAEVETELARLFAEALAL